MASTNVLVLATSFGDGGTGNNGGEGPGVPILDKLQQEMDVSVTYRCKRDPSEPLSADEMEGIHIVIADLERYERSLLARIGSGGTGDLRLIVRYGVGIDNVDVEAATDSGVLVANTPGANSRPTAEWTLAVCGRLPNHHSRAGSGLRKSGPSRVDLTGKTVGVVGTGAVG